MVHELSERPCPPSRRTQSRVSLLRPRCYHAWPQFQAQPSISLTPCLWARRWPGWRAPSVMSSSVKLQSLYDKASAGSHLSRRRHLGGAIRLGCVRVPGFSTSRRLRRHPGEGQFRADRGRQRRGNQSAGRPGSPIPERTGADYAGPDESNSKGCAAP